MGDAQRDELWHERYNQLKEFHAKHGTTEIPRSGPSSNTQLLKWLRRQREAFRCERLSSSRKALLDQLSFDFDGDLAVRTERVREQNWKDRYGQLKALVAEKGEVDSIESNKDTEPILKWCKKQQRLYQEGSLHASHKSLLDELGFKFEDKKKKKPKSLKAMQGESSEKHSVEDAANKKRKRGNSEGEAKSSDDQNRKKAKASVLLLRPKKKDKKDSDGKDGIAEIENGGEQSPARSTINSNAEKAESKGNPAVEAGVDQPKDAGNKRGTNRSNASSARSSKRVSAKSNAVNGVEKETNEDGNETQARKRTRRETKEIR